MPPLPGEDVAFTMDSVRTRVYSLGALTEGERRAFVDELLAKARGRVSQVQAERGARCLSVS